MILYQFSQAIIQPKSQNKSWQSASCKSKDKFKLKKKKTLKCMSPRLQSPVILLSQDYAHAHALFRSRHKDHLVWIRRTSCFG